MGNCISRYCISATYILTNCFGDNIQNDEPISFKSIVELQKEKPYFTSEIEMTQLKNTISIELDKFKNILDTYYTPKSEIYKKWINIYKWHQNINNAKKTHNINIFFDEIIFNNKKDHISITLWLSIKNGNAEWSIIIKHNKYNWAERFAKNIDAADKRQIFEFISPEQFMYAINYFKEKNITEFEAFEPLKELLMCEYYNTYVL